MTANAPPPDWLRLHNVHSGEVLDLRQRREGSETVLELRGSLPPRSQGPPMHIHYDSDEEGLVTSGVLSAELGGRRIEVRAGERVLLPRGVAHRWWNDGDEPLGFEGTARPMVDLDRYLQAIFEVVNAGPPGRPPLLYLAHVSLRHRRTQTVLVLPGAVQIVLFRLALAVGTLLGRYRGTDWPGCPARCAGAPAAPAT